MRALIKKLVSPLLRKANDIYLSKPRPYSYKDIEVLVFPSVFPPFLTISTKLLLEFIESLELDGKSFLELGCGCGIISILAAKKGARVTATDINQVALDALKQNAVANAVTVEVAFSDLFNAISDRTFDYIIINPPYYAKQPTTIAENAWFCGEDFEYFERLFLSLPSYLGLQNKAFMILSEDCKIKYIQSIALRNDVHLSLVQTRDVIGERNFIFSLEVNNTSTKPKHS